MKALLQDQPQDDEGLHTFLCKVESIINRRLITKVSDDPRDQEALTPNHLLLLRSGPMVLPGVFVKDDSFYRWRHVQYLADVFWRCWMREYLPALQARQKWNKAYSGAPGGPKGRPAEPYWHHGTEKETHELIFSWLSWLAVLLVGAYARRRRRSCPTWRPYSSR